jgi:hypothetical protein
MEEDTPAKRVLISNPGGARGSGRPDFRWEEGVNDDSKAIGIRKGKSVALNRETWNKRLRMALAHGGLLRR